MADQRIIDYIKAQLPRGFSMEQIKQALVSQGWPQTEVEEAAKVAMSGGSNPMRSSGNNSTNHLNQSQSKEVPVGAKIIGVLNYIIMGFLGFSGGLIILEGGTIGVLLATVSPSLAAIGGIFIAIAVPFFGLGVLYFFLGRGMWKGRNWARIVTLIFAFIGLVGLIVELLMVLVLPSVSLYGGIYGSIVKTISTVPSVIGILVDGWIAIYLLFSKKVKESFV